MFKEGLIARSSRFQSKSASDSELFFRRITASIFERISELSCISRLRAFSKKIYTCSVNFYKVTYCLTHRKPWEDISECIFLG